MSSAAVGSSRSTIAASCASARATTARCRSPPDSVPSGRSANASRSRRSSARAAASRSAAPSRASGPRCGVRPISTYSATVSHGGVSGVCGTIARRRARSRRSSPAASLSRSDTVPSWGRRPAIARRSVVLPAPFGPIRATHSPRSTAVVTSRTTARPPRCTVTPSSPIALTPGLRGCEGRTRRTGRRTAP